MTSTSHAGQIRVSPGVYRPASAVSSALSGSSKNNTPKNNTPKASTTSKTPAQSLPGLTKQQNANINQRQSADNSLGTAANGQLQAISNNFSQPFDYNSLPAAPVTGDYNNWVSSQMGNYNKAFDDRNTPVFKQQADDFEQQMANRGIPMGSDLYNQQKGLMVQGQNDAREQAYAANQGQAVQSAESLYKVGTDARSQAYTMAQARRNQPLADFNSLYASQSGMDNQNLKYSQGLDLQNNQEASQMAIMKATPRSGGGKGSGSGAGGYGGTGLSYQDYLNTQNQSKLQLQQGLNALNPQPQAPSYGAQLGGSLLSSVGQGLGKAAGTYLWSQI